MKNERLNELFDVKKTELDRYYQIKLLNLGLKFYFDEKKDLNCKFVGSEINLKREGRTANEGDILTPDIILQTREKNPIGFAIELKSSLSNTESTKEELLKMQRYNDNLIGWATENQKVREHKIVFGPRFEDSGKVKEAFKQLTENKKIKLVKQFLIWDWALTQSLKFQKKETIILMQTSGELLENDLKKLNARLKEGIEIDTTDVRISTSLESTKFTRKRPPVEYTMLELWENILSRFCNYNNNYTTTVDKVTDFLNSFESALMTNTDGNKFKIRKEWIEEAFDKLVEIELAERKEHDLYYFKFDKYNIRNTVDYICRATAKADIKKYRAKNQKKLK